MAAQFHHSIPSSKLAELVRESREPKKPRELIILVFYIPLGNLSEARSREKIAQFKEMTNETIKGMEKDTNYRVSGLVVPTKNGETKVECIFPKEKDEVVSEFMQEMKEQKLLP